MKNTEFPYSVQSKPVQCSDKQDLGCFFYNVTKILEIFSGTAFSGRVLIDAWREGGHDKGKDGDEWMDKHIQTNKQTIGNHLNSLMFNDHDKGSFKSTQKLKRNIDLSTVHLAELVFPVQKD